MTAPKIFLLLFLSLSLATAENKTLYDTCLNDAVASKAPAIYEPCVAKRPKDTKPIEQEVEDTIKRLPKMPFDERESVLMGLLATEALTLCTLDKAFCDRLKKQFDLFPYRG
ncbi:unnamed protein product [Bursaphelenchus xylophilus]|uniref:(pine wood nematode) hypothetical protein n=1 Tax=Bursaphelenchus xylophilus TaxID=6326 RepID=A0A1I7RTR3_BURXY|nr:unnamed protein product [Bursaphelenchus xylophilus]CAG9122195.1 unnamed protein product [Bursaphelenchus xylophilus]